MASVHPLDRKDLPEGTRNLFWDVFAGTYSAEQQGDMPEKIIDWLFEIGAVSEDREILEVGSGPGTYSFGLAERSKTVWCLDSSEKMLDRLFVGAEKTGMKNLRRMDADWNAFVPKRKWDSVISTLCSGIGSPESLKRMESCSSEYCVIVSWIRNHGDDLQSEIWSELGEEYSYRRRSTDGITEKLRAGGRAPFYKDFRSEVSIELPVNEMVGRQTRTFSVFGLEAEAEKAAEKILSEKFPDGIYRMRAENGIRTTVWKPIE